jgi:hypothetical protein
MSATPESQTPLYDQYRELVEKVYSFDGFVPMARAVHDVLSDELATLSGQHKIDYTITYKKGQDLDADPVFVRIVETPWREEAPEDTAIGWTNAKHRAQAEAIISRTWKITKELREVPAHGINVPITDLPHVKGRTLHKTQDMRRDELGKQLRGMYALAQVHATLALGKDTE